MTPMIDDAKKFLVKVLKAILIFAPMYLIPIIPCWIYGWGVQGYFISFAVTAVIYLFIAARVANRYNLRL